MAFEITSGASLVMTLLVIAWIDWRDHIIPDFWNAVLASLGVVWASVGPEGSLFWALQGMAAALAVSLALRSSYFAIRGRQGLGLGDVKFMTASGAWVGLLGLPFVVLIAAVSGLAFALALQAVGHQVSGASRIAFGPHLAVGLLLTWILNRAGLM